ncbi:amino acid adenylation domain-containing protein [Blastococcus sp. SYSU DS0669]
MTTLHEPARSDRQDPAARTPQDPAARTPQDPAARTPQDPAARTPQDAAGRYWRDVLLAGGTTSLPRWATPTSAGVTDVDLEVDGPTTARLRELATELAVPLSTLVLAAHARVLAALSGEAQVVTSYVTAPGARPLPCLLPAAAPSWRALVAEVSARELALRAAAGHPVDDLRAELGTPGPISEAEFDPAGRPGPPSPGAVIRLELEAGDDRLLLRLRHRTEVLDASAAHRIAGYHRAALTALTVDPDADPGAATLLSGAELDHQVHGLAGPRRPLPEERPHELVRRQVAERPDAVALERGDARWTYVELAARADQVTAALLDAGLADEDVVAVVTERSMEWAAAVLGVLQAGGAYLPLEPHFPPARIASALGRAGVRLVLTEDGSRGSLDTALADLPAVRTLDLGAVCSGDPVVARPVAVPATGLAYLYFTSGSTGEPKGAMCEHAGMLNHLLAKISDLGLDEHSVVAQTAPQCFDISLWQLLGAWLVGGRTVLVPQDVVLDVGRFVDTLVERRISVLQIVPSYLEVVLAHLQQHPRDLPDLRVVSVTGEAVKPELVQRWFDVLPTVPLVNAYGLTETSDDTNHEVLHRPPDGDRVPLGRPVQNVTVYVLDDRLRPVPLGAPGEIAFSGVCVGRGYVNDPERTARAFLADPLRPGHRLYRSGDQGRWRPDGKLEYLGRQDHQVKVAGFRIELGEVENALLRLPGVRDAAVVVTGSGRGARLVACWTGDAPAGADQEFADLLAATLPAYMVPTVFCRRPELPLTGNGKVDRKALTALAADLRSAAHASAPAGPTEQRLAALWSTVLGVPVERIGRETSFVEAGGTSLSVVRLAAALDRAVSLGDIARTPVLADLAALLDERAASVAASAPRVPADPAR